MIDSLPAGISLMEVAAAGSRLAKPRDPPEWTQPGQHLRLTPARDPRPGGFTQLRSRHLGRGSFVPTNEMARLRGLTRYRTKLTQERTREIQRVQKLLEDANIKLDSVITDVMGTSAREMLDALIAGETDVEAMAQMARTRMRPKIPELRLALEGRFDVPVSLI